MAQIINLNPEDNPRLNEIYQVLLLAGYFRIRIASLKPFDKVVGGIAWCITSSNFEIDVEYNDEMQIGQKIKVSQIICDSLYKMKCPYTLQPFQLQGLDVNNIFPIVQWLVKFVYETRFQRQKYDRELSMILGQPITQISNKGNADKILISEIQKTRVNRAIQKTNYNNPVRVYSALLEYNDASATKMYNKWLNITTGKAKRSNKGGEKGKKGKQNDIVDFLQEDEEVNVREDPSMNQFGNVNQKLSLDRLERIISENKNIIEEGVKQTDIEDKSVMNNLSISKEEGQSRKNGNQDQKMLKQAKLQNKKFQQKIQILQNQLQSFTSILNQLDTQIQQIKLKHEQTQTAASEQLQKNNEYKQMQKQIQEQLKASKTKVNSKLQKLVERRQQLKQKKADIKKKAKAKIDELNYQSQLAQASVPEIDQQVFKQMLRQAQLKKDIYDKKYQELTLVNQQIAILQRKMQNYTSPPEIAQYHQRFVEIFELINILIQQKRSMYSEIQNYQSLKKVVLNFLQILSNIRNGYTKITKKGQIKQFNENMKQILSGLETNSKNSEIAVSKMKSKRESIYAEYMDLIKLQREYLINLRMLKLQYQNAAKYYK